MGCSPHLFNFYSHYSWWTHDLKSPGIATMMVGPCNYQLIGLVMIPYHAAVGNRQVTATAAATAACKCEGWGVLRVPTDFGCQWLARWALLTNEKHIQYRTGRHTYSTTQFANQILIAYKLDMTQ